jgi:DNA-binding response OmpR family regulator
VETRGSRATVALSVREAEAALAAGRYDALLLDLLLPDADGLKLLGHIRRDPALADMPVIVVSARATDAATDFAANGVGILDWIAKPVDERRLAAALALVMRRPPRDQARILHVEDDDDIAAVLAALIGNRAETIRAASVRSALDHLAEQRFDLVILDLDLPDGTGYEILAWLGNEGGEVAPPILIFSALDPKPEHIHRAAEVLIKSATDNARLLDHIERLLGTASAIS